MNAAVVPPAGQGFSMAPDRALYLAQLHDIVAALESGNEGLFESRLNQLLRAREEGLFVNLAKLTRELHQAMHDMNFDERLQEMAGNDIPDACVRLDYVAKLGEDAAHRTLDLVDSSRGLLDRINAARRDMATVREHMENGTGAAPCVEALSAWEHELHAASTDLRANFSAVSQAQEYQDLSGQVIRRVITLVHNVEGALIKLLHATNSGVKAKAGGASTAPGELAGPVVPGLANAASTSQQEADALLAELGF